jgi:hypothetical protein
VDSQAREFPVDPEAKVAGFIDSVVDRVRKVPVQVLDQDFRVRPLREALMIRLTNIDAGLPTFSCDIDPDVDMLTGELDFCKFAVHAKPPSGGGILLVDTTIYTLDTRLSSS